MAQSAQLVSGKASDTARNVNGEIAVFGGYDRRAAVGSVLARWETDASESPATVVLAIRLAAGTDGTSWLQRAHVRIMKNLSATSACADLGALALRRRDRSCNERMCGL